MNIRDICAIGIIGMSFIGIIVCVYNMVKRWKEIRDSKLDD